MWGGSPSPCPARPPDAAIQPACRPITSRMNTLVDVSHMDLMSRLASRVDVAMYFATEPKPGQQSVKGRSLSTVFGTPMQVIGYPIFSASWDTLKAVSWESPPPF